MSHFGRKRTKPNLVDPKVDRIIDNTLAKIKKEEVIRNQVIQEEITKNDISFYNNFKKLSINFYQKYIKKNILTILLVIVIIAFLIYRYRYVKNKRNFAKIQETIRKNNLKDFDVLNKENDSQTDAVANKKPRSNTNTNVNANANKESAIEQYSKLRKEQMLKSIESMI
jgi:uncharacterized protein YxeA